MERSTQARQGREEITMPIFKVKGGYRYGKHGKVYKQRSKAVKQGIAIKISQLNKK